jgi:hypothetical protein
MAALLVFTWLLYWLAHSYPNGLYMAALLVSTWLLYWSVHGCSTGLYMAALILAYKTKQICQKS